MTDTFSLTRREKRFVGALAITLVSVWLCLALLPLIALKTPFLQAHSPEEAERIHSVLGQFGTYGDMFGALTCLFSGFAFLGVIITAILHQKELARMENELRESRKDRELAAHDRHVSYMLTSIGTAAQVYAIQFASNPDYYMKLYHGATEKSAADNRSEHETNIDKTVFGKLLFYHGFLDEFAGNAIRDWTLKSGNVPEAAARANSGS